MMDLQSSSFKSKKAPELVLARLEIKKKKKKSCKPHSHHKFDLTKSNLLFEISIGAVKIPTRYIQHRVYIDTV